MNDPGLKDDPEFLGSIQVAVMENYKSICDAGDRADMAGLTPQDVIALATGRSINDILPPLRKLIRLLPVTPVETEDLKRIYELAVKIMVSA